MRATTAVCEPRRRCPYVTLAVTAVPLAVRVQQFFAARCSVATNADAPLRLYLQVGRVPVDVSGISPPEMAPDQPTTCTIKLTPICVGQQTTFVRVADLTSKKTHAADSPVVTVL